MVIHFQLNYLTQWGEHIAVEIDGNANNPVVLSTEDGKQWETTVKLPHRHAGELVTYRYSVWRGTQRVRQERGAQRHIIHAESQVEAAYFATDNWRDLPQHNALFSLAFSGDFGAEHPASASLAKSTYTLRVLCPTLRQRGLKLALVGESKALGAWNPAEAIVFEEVAANHWQLTLDTKQLESSSDYKFVTLNSTGKVEEWEGGNNRQLLLPQLDEGVHFFAPEIEVYFSNIHPRIAGTAVPVFSLRSEGSQGVGDFGDLKHMVDWAVATKQKALQILPINDTTITGTWVDSYPYNSISIYAFHPMYVDLREVPKLNNAQKQAQFDKEFRELNALPQVDYDRVNKTKRDYLLLAFRESGKQLLETQEFKIFLDKNSHWLRPYAAFSYLRDKFGTPDFSKWPEHSTYDKVAIEQLCSKENKAWEVVAYYYYIQYLLHVQLLAASDYARSKGVMFKGDIPIGISRNSVEAWIEPYYFNMNGQAGAPPDAFSANGQNWGFPTYNWEVMKQDGYQWWKRRFAKMAEYFTAYRIDHILGFFRIWEIPSHSVQGLLGQFTPALPMSPEEIGTFGLYFQKDFMTSPFICDEILHRVFGDQSEWVKQTFLVHSHYDVWSLRPEYATQRAVEAYFNKEGKSMTNAEALKNGVFSLINNVLFVEDHKQHGLYHPRIAAQQSFIYERLQQHEKDAFNRLYNHYFYERHNQFWYDCAMEKLPELCEAAPMLPCGEDLGMVPDCVPWVMNELQLLSLEIERMPKNPQHEFGNVEWYPERSVCTIGTHDMATFRGWWREDYSQTCRYYYDVLHLGGEVPGDAPGWVCEEVVRRHLNSPSMLAILALQDWFAMDEKLRFADAEGERINVPANPRHYWRYRMHLSIESLLQQVAFNQRITNMVEQSGRQ